MIPGVVLNVMLALAAGPDTAESSGVGGTNRRAHDIHLTHTRLVVDGASVICRIRLFHDDLETVLRRHAGRSDLNVTPAHPQDSVFADYFRSRVSIRSDGVNLSARVLQSGPDADAADFPMWWYLVELKAPGPVRMLGVRYNLFFEQFDDQRNILTILKTPDERHSLYFAAGDEKEQVVRFAGPGQ